MPFEETFPQAADFWNKLTYTGYLVHRMPARALMSENERPVLVSSGGGKTEDGFQLYKTAILSKKLLPSAHPLQNHPWIVLVSHAYSPAAFLELQLRAASDNAGVSVQRNMDAQDFRRAVSNAALCISLSGYNTVIEMYAADVPAVLLPFHNAAQGQLFRAKAFACLGKMTILGHQNRSDPYELIARIDEAYAKRKNMQPQLSLEGDRIAAETIARDLRGLPDLSPAVRYASGRFTVSALAS